LPDSGRSAQASVVADAPGVAAAPRAVRLLLVEDNDLVLSLAAAALEKEGYGLDLASSAESAVPLLATVSEPYDVLVTDLVLPGINGYELADRAREACPGIRVLFVSGYAAAATMPPGPADAVVGFLQKPYSPSQLTEAVAALLQQRP
jgi:two-component system cell cycle sensor histidine kinase/response regulator CckA